MDFLDKVRIVVKAGNGGDGCAAFHREKFVMKGGPSGGDGGNGGSVVFYADPRLNTLLPFRFQRFYRAENGGKGLIELKRGKDGEDMVIHVPVGTVVRDLETGAIVADMSEPERKKVVIRGGRGGKGNARFATATKQAPQFAQSGVKTEEREMELELKTIADVGIIGLPSVGKSSILSVLTAAKPKIAAYHFTTLTPNLGVAEHKGKSFVMADIPGLIEGAAEGAGLGHDFLRHIERTRLLVHVIDASGMEGRDPVEDFHKINEELTKFSVPGVRRHGGGVRGDVGCGDPLPGPAAAGAHLPRGGAGDGPPVREGVHPLPGGRRGLRAFRRGGGQASRLHRPQQRGQHAPVPADAHQDRHDRRPSGGGRQGRGHHKAWRMGIRFCGIKPLDFPPGGRCIP